MRKSKLSFKKMQRHGQGFGAKELRLWAETFKEELDGVMGKELAWDAELCAILSASLDRGHTEWIKGELDEETAINGLANVGPIFGELLIRAFDGHWEYIKDRDDWAVVVGRIAVLPFRQITRHLKDGESQDILAVFYAIQAMVDHYDQLMDECKDGGVVSGEVEIDEPLGKGKVQFWAGMNPRILDS